MSELNSIMPPEFNLTRGEAYNYHLVHNNIPHDNVIRNIILEPNTPLKDLSAIQNDTSASDQLATAINLASTELQKFIKN